MKQIFDRPVVFKSNVIMRRVIDPDDTQIAANEIAFWFDSTNGAPKLMIKAK